MSDMLGSVIKECDPPKDSGTSTATLTTSANSNGDFNQEIFNMKKEQRTVDRVSAWKSKNKK